MSFINDLRSQKCSLFKYFQSCDTKKSTSKAIEKFSTKTVQIKEDRMKNTLQQWKIAITIKTKYY